MGMVRDDIWSEEQDEILRKLWAKGVETRVIGERVGRSKNAVIGRARRMGLPEHPAASSVLPADMTADFEDYIAGKVSARGIADKYDVTPGAVYMRMRRDGIGRHDRREASVLFWRRLKGGV